MKYLAEAGANLEARDRHGNTPLHSASFWNRLDVVKFLITEAGVSVVTCDSAGYTPLHIALEMDNLQVANYLRGAEVYHTSLQYLSDLYRVRWTCGAYH